MRKGCRIWGNAERLNPEKIEDLTAALRLFETVEIDGQSLNVEHEEGHVDEDDVAEAARAVADALGPTGFGQLDLIDQNQDFVLRFSIEPGRVQSRKTGTNEVLEKYNQQ